MSSRDRKWRLALWTWLLCALLVVGAFGRWMSDPTVAGAGGIITQGLSGIGGVLALYGAANVAQKGVVGKNYRPELDDKNGGRNGGKNE
jgi:hypothetical protein